MRSLSRPPVSSAVSRGTGLEDEPSRHPQEEDPPPAMLLVACCALRSVLCAALVAFAAAMIRCCIISKGFHYIWRLFFLPGDRGHNFVTYGKKSCVACQLPLRFFLTNSVFAGLPMVKLRKNNNKYIRTRLPHQCTWYSVYRVYILSLIHI